MGGDSGIILPDGGQVAEMEEPEEQRDEEAEQPQETEDESVEESEEPSEEREYQEEEGTNVLHLDLEGLFLDLLGLEVDLNEVVLDIRAVPGEGNLLGNLLGQVAGLFDNGLRSMIGLGISKEDLLGKVDDISSGVAQRIRGGLGSIVEEIPLEDIFKQIIRGIINQIFDQEETST